MNPSGSEFTLRVAICDLVERLKRMQHKCSYLEECRNQLVKEVIRLRIQNEWLAKQMQDSPNPDNIGNNNNAVNNSIINNMNSNNNMNNINNNSSNNNNNNIGFNTNTIHNMNNVSAEQCFCNLNIAAGSESLVGANQPPSQHQPNCPFSGENVEYFVSNHGDISSEQVRNINSVNNANGSSANNNAVSDESLHLMNILNQFEAEDNNASKENSIKNLTLQMLKELENEMRTGKLKSDLLKLVNHSKKSTHSADQMLHFDDDSKQSTANTKRQEYSNSNNNIGDKSLESLDDSGSFERLQPKGSKDISVSVSSWNVSKQSNINKGKQRNMNECSTDGNGEFGSKSMGLLDMDLTNILKEDELMALVSLIRRDIKALQQDVQFSTDRLSKIKQKNDNEKFRHYFQKQIKSESAGNQPANLANISKFDANMSNMSNVTSNTSGAQATVSVSVSGNSNAPGNGLSAANNLKANLKLS